MNTSLPLLLLLFVGAESSHLQGVYVHSCMHIFKMAATSSRQACAKIDMFVRYTGSHIIEAIEMEAMYSAVLRLSTPLKQNTWWVRKVNPTN